MTQTSKVLLALLVTIPAAGCMTGPKAENFQPVRSAKGVQLTLGGRKAAVKGELLEVRDNELVVLETRDKKADGQNDCAVLLIAFSQIRDVAFKGINPRWGGGMPDDRERAELRMLSRFPTGITPPVMQQLLSCSVGAAPQTITL